jgi:hypothetical protein
VRLYPENDLGDLQYPVGKAPAQVSTTLEAHGDPGNWPFDSYKTEVIAADVFTGSGQNREKVPARVEVTGKLDGWDATATRIHEPEDSNPDVLDDVTITLQRSKGPLIFDFGICLVLIALPALALWVAIPMALGRTAFLPPFITWYAAMLFAIVPMRSILPGSPTIWFVDRPSHCAVGVDWPGRCDVPVPGRLVAIPGSKAAQEGLIPLLLRIRCSHRADGVDGT